MVCDVMMMALRMLYSILATQYYGGIYPSKGSRLDTSRHDMLLLTHMIFSQVTSTRRFHL